MTLAKAALAVRDESRGLGPFSEATIDEQGQRLEEATFQPEVGVQIFNVFGGYGGIHDGNGAGRVNACVMYPRR